jgi:hypothetical protein
MTTMHSERNQLHHQYLPLILPEPAKEPGHWQDL